MPLLLILALVIAGTNGPRGADHPKQPSVLPAVSVSPGEDTADATVSTCAQIISQLPLTLDGAQLRRTVSDPPTSSVVAWGDPAIVLRCGVTKPSQLNPSFSEQYVAVNDVLYLPVRGSKATVFTVVDRRIYLDVTVPTSYTQPPLGPIADAILKVLPKPVCTDDNAAPRDQLCTRRK